jgi:hypothetical protein
MQSWEHTNLASMRASWALCRGRHGQPWEAGWRALPHIAWKGRWTLWRVRSMDRALHCMLNRGWKARALWQRQVRSDLVHSSQHRWGMPFKRRLYLWRKGSLVFRVFCSFS